MARLRYNNSVGTLGASLTNSGTTITFAAAPSFATIASPDFIAIILEPEGSSPSANFEVVYLTAYTAAATTGTISRGQEGTTGVAHSNGVAWAVGAVRADVLVQNSNYVSFSSSGTWNIPPEVKGGGIRIRCTGGGGGGGGGAGGNTSNAAVGGGGAGAGMVMDQHVTLNASDSALTITVGSAGGVGTAGTANGGAGSDGTAGGNSTVVGVTTAVTYVKAFGGTRGGGASSPTSAGWSGAWSNIGLNVNVNGTALWGGGGTGGSAPQNIGRAVLSVTGGGSGGTGSSTTNGGGGGNACTALPPTDQAGGSTGGSGTAVGAAGTAATIAGCGGGGGGGGAQGTSGNAGGAGGAGAAGLVEIWW